MPKQPQDHKPKAKRPAPFEFDADGETYELPLASEGRAKLTGRDFRDAAMGGEIGQLEYLFKALEASAPKEDALDALYAMPQPDMMEVLERWGDYGDGDGASLGE